MRLFRGWTCLLPQHANSLVHHLGQLQGARMLLNFSGAALACMYECEHCVGDPSTQYLSPDVSPEKDGLCPKAVRQGDAGNRCNKFSAFIIQEGLIACRNYWQSSSKYYTARLDFQDPLNCILFDICSPCRCTLKYQSTNQCKLLYQVCVLRVLQLCGYDLLTPRQLVQS